MSMKKVTLILVLLTLLTGCQSYLNYRAPPGEMGADGKVNKCNDYRTNPQACGEAIYNAPRVAKISIGQPIAEVRQIMARDPEERSAKTQDGQAIEVWAYLTNYANSIKTIITFKDGKVISIESVQR